MRHGSTVAVRTAVLFVVMMAATIIQYVLGALGPYLTTAIAIPEARYGWLLTGVYVVAGTASLVGGRAVAALGFRRVFTVTVAMVAGLFLVAGVAAGPGTFALVVAAFGVPLAIVNPAINAYVTAQVPTGSQARHFGVLHAGVAFGALVAAAVLPVAVERSGWRIVVVGTGMVAAAALPVVHRIVAQDAPPTVRDDPRAGGGRGSTGVLGVSLYAFFVGAIVAATVAYLTLFAHSQLGFTRATAAMVLAVMSVVSGVARVSWGMLLERWPRPQWLLAGLGVLMALGAASMATAGTGIQPGLVWTGAVMFGASSASWTPVGTVFLVRAVPGRAVAHATGRMLSAYYVGLILGPVCFGVIISTTNGYVAGWSVLMVAAMAATGVVLRRPASGRRGNGTTAGSQAGP